MTPRPRTAIWASALGIAIFEVVGTFGAANNQPERNGVDALALALVLLGPLALGLRDRWPLGAVAVAVIATDAYLALGYAYGPVFIAVVVALVYAVQRGRRRGAWALAAAGYLGFVVADAFGRRHDAAGGNLAHLALVAGWLALVLAVAEVVRIRRVQAHDRRRAEAEEGRRAQGEQRLQLAQELHDVLAHHISLINVQAGVALHLFDEHPEQAGPALAHIKDASHEALQELRAALDLLRHDDTAPRAPAPGLADLDTLVDGVRASGLDVRLDASPLPTLPAATELAAYRIVQEALTNVTRHAHATSATVRVDAGAGGLTVEVTDDGSGGGPADAAAGGGNGLVGMRERAASLGGTVEAGPRVGGGFRVLARLP